MLKYKIINIESKSDERGELSFVQNSNLPFETKRFFWIKPKKEKERGNHANHKCKQCIICISGKYNMSLDDGKDKEEVILSKNKGLILEPNIWRTMSDFSDDCILLILASEEYDEKDYIRDYRKFKNLHT
jgi:dTDP-4-dehydrorhamnose 3,5-epimerase